MEARRLPRHPAPSCIRRNIGQPGTGGRKLQAAACLRTSLPFEDADRLLHRQPLRLGQPPAPCMSVAVRFLDPPRLRLDRLPVAEELVVGVAAAVSAADLGETGGEVDAGQPFDLLEVELDLVAQPQRAPCPWVSGAPFAVDDGVWLPVRWPGGLTYRLTWWAQLGSNQ